MTLCSALTCPPTTTGNTPTAFWTGRRRKRTASGSPSSGLPTGVPQRGNCTRTRTTRRIWTAHSAGIQTGAYLYSQAVTVEEAEEEAAYLLKRLEGRAIDGPVCYDWEIADRSSRTWSVSRETATACAAAFCARIAEAGYQPLIYESKEVGYLKYDQGELEPYMRWYPQYPDPRAQTPCPDFLYQMDLWQFSDRCTVDGIGKRTDGNLWLRARDGA